MSEPLDTIRTNRPRLAAEGYPECKRRRVAVTFTTEMFGQIQDMAKRQGTSFGEAVRRCCAAFFSLPDDDVAGEP